MGTDVNSKQHSAQKKRERKRTEVVATVGQLGACGGVGETIERLLEAGVLHERAGVVGVGLRDGAGV